MKATCKIMAEGAGLIARCLGRALPNVQSANNGEQASSGKSARPLMPVMGGSATHRSHNRAQSMIKAGVLLAAGLLAGAAHAATAPGTIISNTAQAAYQVNANPTTTTTLSNTVQNTVVAPGSASIVAAFNPDIVNAGGSTTATVQVCNTGGSPIAGGILTLTPPAGTAMTIPADPYGNYTAAVQPGGNWIVTLTNPLASGACINVPTNVTIPAATPSGTLTMPVTFTGGGLPPIAGVATLTVQNIRTPSTTTFMQIDPISGLLVPVTLYHAGQLIYVQVQDLDQNLNPLVAETVTATIVDSITGDSETLVLIETGPNTGIFTGFVSSTIAAATPNNGILSVTQGSALTATYTDIVDGTDSTSAAALVDPFGLVFDSTSGLPVSNATVTLIDVATGLPAQVFGDNGVATYPATVITGTSATDSAGNVYTFGPGFYRFPMVNPGTYRLQITPPAGYAAPSTVPTPTLQLLPGAPFAIAVGSRGENFIVNPGPALHIDVPLDPKATTLFVQKTTTKLQAAMGDFVPYNITIENPGIVNPVTAATVLDVLPPGFRYQPGTTKLDGVKAADPVIATNGRNLTFNIGTVAPAAVHTLTYVAEITANVQLGPAVNIATASGTQLGLPVASNIGRATLTIIEDLFASRSFLAGRVFVDDNGDGFNDKNESGVAGIRIFMEDGRSVTSDKNGMFHFEGIVPRTHIVQMDLTTIPTQYEAVPLANTRFSGRAFSQFAEVQGGGLWRTNFRLLRKAPPATPVTISQSLASEEGKIWTTLTVTHGDKVNLSSLKAVYVAPAGWTVLEDTATVDGVPAKPGHDITGLTWNLDTHSATPNNIRFALQGGGESGDKQAVAYARFTSPGSPNGRTGMAANTLNDVVSVERKALQLDLHLNFATRKADLSADSIVELDKLAAQLSDLEISRIELIGHTDDRRIRHDHREEFANNQVLSEARAKSVGRYLQEKLKLGNEQVKAEGVGAADPVASNDTEAGRADNRRTELIVYGNKVRHVLSTSITSASARAEGQADGSWDKPAESSKQNIAVQPAPSDVKAWLATAQAGTRWLFPTDKDLPSIPATHVLVQHAPDQKVNLTLNGQTVSALAFEGSKRNAAGTIAISHWRNVHLTEGENAFVAIVSDAAGHEVTRIEHNVHYASPPVRAEWLSGKSTAIADGLAQPRIAVRLTDKSGQPARRGIIGDVEISLPYHGADEPLADIVKQNYKPQFTVSEDGIAYIVLKPTTQAGEVKLTFRLESGAQEITAWVKPATRDWIMVGLGDGTLGYNKIKGAMQPINKQSEKDKYYRDGRLAFYAKGRVKGDFLLTAAYDTAKTRGQVGKSVNQVIDPNNYYTLYGDATEQQYDAASQSKLYLKLERNTFYALFGDFDTGLTVTELSRYSRTMNGLKSEYRGEMLGYNAFATRTSQTLVKDELRGDGTSGLYRLSRRNLVANSEKVFVETRDRFKSEVILDSRQLVSHVDYSIDYVDGTLFFKQPVLSKDANLNPIYIRVEYESDDQNDKFTQFGGRASVKPVKGAEIGASYIQQGQLGSNDTLAGVDASYKITEQDEVKGEYARSKTRTVGKANAWKAELNHSGEKVRGQAYVRQLDGGFGLGQTLGSEDATRKFGALADTRITDKVNLQTEAYRQQGLTTGAKRDLGQAQANYNAESYSLRGGARYVKDKDGAGTTTTSKQLTAGGTQRITDRLSARVDREQNLGKGNNSADFPTRTSVGADYQLTMSTTLSATHEWTQGNKQNSETTRLGVRTQPWNGAQLSTSYEEQTGESGPRSFANVGLEQQWKATDTLSFQAGFDHSKTIKHPGANALNLNTPLASGGGNDFSAYSLGMTYNPEGWVWNNRVEYRTASTDKKWNLATGLQGEIYEWLTSAFNLQWNQSRQITGTASTLGTSSLALAWRPDYDGLMLLDRFELAFDKQVAPTTKQTTWKYINNLAGNWQASPAFQLAFNYGAKWTKDNIDTFSLTGFSDVAGLQAVYDINEEWDISAQGGMLHTWHSGQFKPAAGIGIGHRVTDNLWVSLGYNFVGFYDKDFAASEFPRQGIFLRFRFKLDQSDLKGMLESIQ